MCRFLRPHALSCLLVLCVCVCLRRCDVEHPRELHQRMLELDLLTVAPQHMTQQGEVLRHRESRESTRQRQASRRRHARITRLCPSNPPPLPCPIGGAPPSSAPPALAWSPGPADVGLPHVLRGPRLTGRTRHHRPTHRPHRGSQGGRAVSVSIAMSRDRGERAQAIQRKHTSSLPSTHSDSLLQEAEERSQGNPGQRP